MRRTNSPAARRIAAALAMVSLATVPLLACSRDDAEPSRETKDIIHGEADNERAAVVALVMEDKDGEWSSCTGTIVRTDPATKIGHVLTAAHCLKDVVDGYAFQGADSEGKTAIRFSFLDHASHPRYNGVVSSPYDIGMVRIVGVDRSTPIMPMLAADTLARGTRVLSVGYGRTTRPIADAVDTNTVRNRIQGTVESISTMTLGVRYDNDGDICMGDSGGPVIVSVGGKDYAVGVHSYVTGPCVGVGYSVRASGHDAFLRSAMGAPQPAPSCALCTKTIRSGGELCGTQARDACFADAQCNGLLDCLGKCSAVAADAGGGDAGAAANDACRKACSTEFPFGAAKYNHLLVFCACNACESECATDTTECAHVPKCNMKLGAESCTSCMESTCCAEMDACSREGHCYRCTKTEGFAGCGENALYQKLQACKAKSCTTACAAP